MANRKLVAVIAVMAAFSKTALAQSVSILPEPIPPGFDFPAHRSVVQAWADQRDVVAARRHAWKVWEGMNQPSRAEGPDGETLPIWETWFSSAEAFPPQPADTRLTAYDIVAKRDGPSRPLNSPVQFHGGVASTPDRAFQVLSFNKFNPAAGSFILNPHPGPRGFDYYYNDRASLMKLNQDWPADTPLAQRGIQEFPLRAIETKPVFMLVKKSGLTAVPYWMGPVASTDPSQPTPDTWVTCVLFDPMSDDTLRTATSEQIKGASTGQAPACKSYLYAGLSQIYSYPLTKEGAEAIKKDQGSSAEAGDHAVLVAMHVNTKEILNWTWQTYFWSGRQNPPNSYPGSIYEQPSSLQSPWNNYAMCTAYWQAELSGDVKVCFNPYLETATSGIPDGLNSNCMSCHGIARTPPLNNAVSPNPTYPANYSHAIDVGPELYDPFYFSGNTNTDFSWAVGNAAQQQ